MTDIDIEETKKIFKQFKIFGGPKAEAYGRSIKEIAFALITEVEGLRKLVEAQREYIGLLERQQTGWDSRWPKSRTKIAEIEKEMGK